MEDYSELRQQLERRFADFLDHDLVLPGQAGTWSYARALEDLYEQGDGGDGKGDGADGSSKSVRIKSRRLMVAEEHLRRYDEGLLLELLRKPGESLPAFEDALKTFVKKGVDPVLQRALEESGSDELHIGLKGDFGKFEVTPRELTSSLLNQLVCVFGIVTKCSLVRPKMVSSVHYSEVTKEYTTMQYRDVTATRGGVTSTVYPQYDNQGNPLTTEFGLCKYIDNQTLHMQELPETAPPGQLPHSAEIILEGDLVDKCKPGDRVSVVGIYKPMTGRQTGAISAVYKAVVVGISVKRLTKDSQTKVTMADAREIKRLAATHSVLDLLGSSLAPSIYGHETIKKGLVLMLFGGLEKTLENGTHLRGDINALMVGDPGVAKSQLLRAVMNIAPLAVSTTGRGSSGVGLTAAVTTDGETGERRLEAGAMVLADRGVVCIDEFDKMSDQDRVAIHEVMEQQTVTIAKAGIHTSLNARCSVLAAANPLYGSYDRHISVTRNVNLPDSLLSRFDMLFVVLDSMNDERDRQVALHVLRQHQYRAPGDDGRGLPLQETIHDRRLSAEHDPSDLRMWLKVDTRLHGAAAESQEQVLTTEFLRKYLIFAKRKYARAAAQAAQQATQSRAGGVPGGLPMEEAAVRRIIDYYVSLRALPHTQRNFPVTARCLETLIRLATAHCKVRLGDAISRNDVGMACAMMDHVMRREIVGEEQEAPGGKRRGGGRRGRGGAGSDDDEDGDDGDNNAVVPARGADDVEMRDAEAGSQQQGEPAASMGRAGTQSQKKRGRASVGEDDEEGTAAARAAPGQGRGGNAAAEAAGALAGVRVVASEAEARQDGDVDFPTLESLTDAAKAAIVAQVSAFQQERGEDDLIEVQELQAAMAQRGVSASEAALCGYLSWVSRMYEHELARGNFLPNVAYDAEAKLFGFM